MSKHILVVSQYYFPENFRINDITKKWVKRGYKVTVVTGIPNYPKGRFFKGYGYFKKRKEVIEGIKIVRLPIIPRFNSSLFLALNYLSFVISGWFWAKFTRVKADYVFNFEVSPVTQVLPAIWFASRRNIPCYFYVTDLWPESFVFATKIKSKFVINKIQNLVDYIYKRVTKILISSRGFYNPIEARGICRDKIVYWPQFPEDIYTKLPILKSKNLLPNDNVFNITFAGNIGYAQGLSVLIEVSKMLKDMSVLVRFNIVGDGRYLKDFFSTVEKNKVMSYFNFIGRKPASEIPKYLAETDVAFISLENEKVFDYTLPSKIQTYLACGVPIIGSANGELNHVINESKSGFCSDSGDSEGLLKNILKMRALSMNDLQAMRINGVNYSERNFNKEVLLSQLDSELFNK